MSIRYRFALVFMLALGSWASPSKAGDRTPCRQRACDFEIVQRVQGCRLARGDEAIEAPPVAFEDQTRRPPDHHRRQAVRPLRVSGRRQTTRPFFESIHAPDGTQVTRNNPPVEGKDLADHPTFHPGLWLAFGDLNGADSWRNKDRIRHAGFVEPPQGGPGRGTFAVRNRHEKGGKVIGEEVCRITVLVRPEGYLLLWDSEFRPVGGDLVFGDQEEMGLGVRVATPLAVVKGGRIIDSEGRVNEAQVWGRQADWCSYSGRGRRGAGRRAADAAPGELPPLVVPRPRLRPAGGQPLRAERLHRR